MNEQEHQQHTKICFYFKSNWMIAPKSKLNELNELTVTHNHHMTALKWKYKRLGIHYTGKKNYISTIAVSAQRRGLSDMNHSKPIYCGSFLAFFFASIHNSFIKCNTTFRFNQICIRKRDRQRNKEKNRERRHTSDWIDKTRSTNGREKKNRISD